MVIASYVRKAEKLQRRKAGTIEGGNCYDFRLYPTCPPSTSIVFRGGLAWFPGYSIYPQPIFLPSYTVDLTDSDKVSVRRNYSSYTYTFTNADWYVPCIVIITALAFGSPPEPPATWPTDVPNEALYLYGGTTSAPYMTEYETAAGAEQALMNLSGESSAYYGIATGGLILRNNGNTASENQWMPIDKINRGRSYLFGQKRYGWELG